MVSFFLLQFYDLLNDFFNQTGCGTLISHLEDHILILFIMISCSIKLFSANVRILSPKCKVKVTRYKTEATLVQLTTGFYSKKIGKITKKKVTILDEKNVRA